MWKGLVWDTFQGTCFLQMVFFFAGIYTTILVYFFPQYKSFPNFVMRVMWTTCNGPIFQYFDQSPVRVSMQMFQNTSMTFSELLWNKTWPRTIQDPPLKFFYSWLLWLVLSFYASSIFMFCFMDELY